MLIYLLIYVLIYVFKSEKSFSEHFWIAVVPVHFSTAWPFPSVRLGFKIKRNVILSNFGRGYQFKNDYMSRNKSTYQNKTDLLKTHTKLSSHPQWATEFPWTETFTPSALWEEGWAPCDFLTGNDLTLEGSRIGSLLRAHIWGAWTA